MIQNINGNDLITAGGSRSGALEQTLALYDGLFAAGGVVQDFADLTFQPKPSIKLLRIDDNDIIVNNKYMITGLTKF